MNETLGSTGMGPEEPVVSSRSGHRNRNVFMLGGLALVLVAGVILAGVFPTGDRAGTTATDPSASPTTSATPSDTATDDPTAEPVAVATCAEGGACVVGDVGPGGGLVFYNAGSRQDWGQYIEMAPKDWHVDCDSKFRPRCSWSDGLSAAASYRGGDLADWVVPSRPVLAAMYSFKSSITDESPYYLDTWLRYSSEQRNKDAAWCQYFDTGKKVDCGKAEAMATVRVVRSF